MLGLGDIGVGGTVNNDIHIGMKLIHASRIHNVEVFMGGCDKLYVIPDE
jgi:hypothetical protein